MKNKLTVRTLLLINSLLLLGLIIYTFYPKNPSDNIVFINSAKVFEGFRMTSEMKISGEKEFAGRAKIVDSLYTLLNDPSRKDSKELMNLFIAEKQSLEQFEQSFANEESAKVWSRISDYAKEFSTEKGYSMVLGMQPNANIVYGDESKDVSEEFIAYINNKYEGNK